ncbi:MAG: hypothetical protein J2P31_20680, partial [Blastocatellia bacterium]|nr:hypothetical protein [Blastocatellia bacterium]
WAKTSLIVVQRNTAVILQYVKLSRTRRGLRFGSRIQALLRMPSLMNLLRLGNPFSIIQGHLNSLRAALHHLCLVGLKRFIQWHSVLHPLELRKKFADIIEGMIEALPAT